MNILKNFIIFLIGITFLLNNSSIYGQTLDVEDILYNTIRNHNKISFTGIKVMEVSRVDSQFKGTAKIEYYNNDNFMITLLEPQDVNGLSFFVLDGLANIYLMKESLYLCNGNLRGLDLIVDTILGKITNNPTLLLQNYSMVLRNDDYISSLPVYVLDFQPKHDFFTPCRRYWIDKKNFQILREERYWAPNEGAYYISYYDGYSTKIDSKPVLNINKKVKTISMSPKDENYFLVFNSHKETEKIIKEKIYLPTYVPLGFVLNNIQVLNLYDAKIIILNYNDGLNNFLVTYRPKQNFFITLLAGIASMNFLKSMSTLSYHSPNNYKSITTNKYMVVTFGDLYPDDLDKIAKSINF